MKKIGIIAIALMMNSLTVKGQTLCGKGTKQIMVGVGLSEYATWYPENLKALKGKYTPKTGVFCIKAEFGIHKYVGLGLSVGANYSPNVESGGITGAIFYNRRFWSLSVPVGFTGNFHFFQMINDLTRKSFAEKLDIYVGVDAGAGPSFLYARNGYKEMGNDLGYLIYGGPHVGIRYYTKPKLGFYAEAGYGYSYLNGGICLKF